MRLGTKRRIYIRSHTAGKRKFSLLLVLLLVMTALLGGAAYFQKMIQPQMAELAESQTTTMAEQAIHRAVSRLLAGRDLSEIVTLSQLEDGTVSAVQSDMSQINRLKAEAAIAINEEIAAIDETELAIPLGTLTGYDILAGTGPRLPVRLMPYGNVVVDFSGTLTESGINQTLLAVNLTATASVGIMLPGVNITDEITTQLPVVQTVIVGKIPDNYVNIDRMGEDYEGDVLDIIG